MKQLGDIAGVFAYLSLLTVGGGMAAFPELKTLTVDVYHWVTFPELLHFYSLGQLAPGPNMMMVASIGAVVAGLPGAAVALVAFFLPTGLLTFAIGRLWTHLATWRWRPAVQLGLGSVSVGLVLPAPSSGPRRAHRPALRCAGRRRVLSVATHQDQSGLSDRGVGPDRAFGTGLSTPRPASVSRPLRACR
jgi:chromate transporter